MKICPLGAELFHVDDQTDRHTYMTNLIVAFRNFAIAPKKTLCNFLFMADDSVFCGLCDRLFKFVYPLNRRMSGS